MAPKQEHASGGPAASRPEATGTGPINSGLACLVLLAWFFDRPVDGEQLRHRHGRAGARFGEVDVLQAAKHLGFKARAVAVRFRRLPKTPLPAIARRADGSFFIVAKIGEEGSQHEGKVLIQDPALGRPEVLDAEDFQGLWTGRLILLADRAQLAGKERRFDVTWFIPAIVKYRRLFGEVLLASLFLQVFGLVSPLFFMVIIDKVLVHRGLSSLDVLIFALVAIAAFEAVMGVLRTYIFSHTTTRVDVELGSKLFKHLMRLPISYFGVRRVGDTVARVRELETIRNFLTGSALTLVIDLAFTAVFFAVMFKFSVTLTFIVLASIPFYVILSVAITPVLRKRVEEKFQRGAENHAFLTESVTGVETLKSLAVEPQMHRRWETHLAEYVKTSFRAGLVGTVGSQGVQLVQKVTLALTLWFGARLVMDGGLTVGQLVAFNMLSQRVSMPILRLAQLWQDFQQARIAMHRLGDILNAPPEPAAGSGRGALPDILGRVQVDGVTFRYRSDGAEVLRNMSLDVPAGQLVGIVGPSGSGKSTLAKLIQRLYVPERGRVLVDGVDLAMADPAWLRRQIGVVPQESILFNRSVRDNIAIADPAMSMDDVVRAAQLAGAHDFVLELPEGYDSIIGERGTSLSGGQRQRIAIARALVSNPKILIFDEATSALDYESEQAIQANMRKICAGRTVFIIAHRLSTVRDSDRIIAIENGAIVEDGTHAELLTAGGRYARLWRSQTGMAPDPTAGPPDDAAPESTSDGRQIVRRPVPFQGLRTEPAGDD